MKYTQYKIANFWLPALFAVLVMGAAACKKDSGNAPPVIKSIRNYVAHPGDSLITKAGPGQWIVISGSNLKGALQIYFDGVPSSFNEALFSDTSAVVLVPAVIAFPIVPTNKLNTIDYVTTHGETTFKVNILPPAPTITSISNENANPGDSVTIYGLNLFFIQSLNYSGVNIPTFLEAVNGTYVSFVVPPLPHSGPVTITTTVGTATTPYNVNDVETDVLSNFDDIFNWAYFGATITNSPTLYPGGRGNYASCVDTGSNKIGASDYAWYNGGRSVNLNGVQWIPKAHMTDPVADYVVKFEMYLKDPWSSGTIYIAANYSFTWIARYEPWQNANGSVTTINPHGWQTVTVPFSTFKSKPNGGYDGQGTSIAALTDLLGASGNTGFNIWVINNSGTPIPAFDAAFDNIRIEKIQ